MSSYSYKLSNRYYRMKGEYMCKDKPNNIINTYIVIYIGII